MVKDVNENMVKGSVGRVESVEYFDDLFNVIDDRKIKKSAVMRLNVQMMTKKNRNFY